MKHPSTCDNDKNIKLDVIVTYTVMDADLRQVDRLRVLRHT